ncbi:3-oxoacyl-ACP reductase [Gordonia sp. PKS22-38]|uniref:3-oxoacyl-ACP reductase n=2 Tax=Gordonia prachuapensis TaxID=3115651 RepID=A0ABU7MYI1_9ACTN|nr:3-oxoacyl-ACP reductase [Gordonia sp. PKS22-38]
MVRMSAVPTSEHVVLVTGGGRGLGAHIVLAAAAQGARVVINYRRSGDAARALADKIGDKAFVVGADVTDRDAVRDMVAAAGEHFGTPVTAVVNNALPDYSFNGEHRSHADDLSWGELDAQFSGVVGGALNVIQAALPGMRSAGGGRIVNIGTNLVQNPVVPYHDYTAAKAALLALTRTMSHDLGPDGITVNMVSGGLLRTTDASAATPSGVFDAIADSTPLRSVTTPEEFADAVLFFLSPWSRAVTGQNLVVDGGLVKN